MFQKLLSFVLAFSIVGAVQRPRGVSLEKASFYQAGKDFRCLTDGKVLPFDHVNDDYCDCEDGSDEPGTSACANGLFYCENKSHKGSYIITSRVNDGICDCCDGGDEFDGTIDCPNVCVEMQQKEQAEQEVFRRAQTEGYKVKQEYMQQGKRAKDEKLSKLSELEREKETYTKEKDAAEAAKNAAEEPEKIAIEEHKKAWEAKKEEKKKAQEAADAAEAFQILDSNDDGKIDYPELMKHREFDIDSDGTVSEEEAREYLEENEEVDASVFSEKIWPNIKEIYKVDKPAEEAVEEQTENVEEVAEEEKDPGVVKEFTKDIPDDIVEGGSHDNELGESEFHDDKDYDNDDDNDNEGDYVDDEDDDDAEYDLNRDGGNLDADVADEDKEPPYDEQTMKLVADADQARSNFNEAENKLKDFENEISEIKKYLEIDFGINQEFAALKDQCFEYIDREYKYKLCPFEKTSQANKNGGMETSLGVWGRWHGPVNDKYDTMKYENGQGCWNGPSRSTIVTLHCGSVNELTSASEPNRCEYHFDLTTPARCDPPTPIDINNTHDEL